MLFEPSMNSQTNPITKFTFKNQHALVSGSDIKIWVPVAELGSYSTEGITCQEAKLKDCVATMAQNEVGEESLLVSLKTSINVAAFSSFDLSIQGLVTDTPRF